MTTTPVPPGQAPAYTDPDLPIRDRVEDLLARMTLEEKAAQLGSAWVYQLTEDRKFSREKADLICKHGLGQVSRVSGASSLTADAAARLTNQIQRHLLTNTRLAIPAIVHEEICSGVMARDSTVYAQAIGVASTFEPDLSRQLADAIRLQMRRSGARQGLSPVLDIVRDPRWGRTEETFGEDPHLTAMMGSAFVAGLQSEDLRQGVAATAKHFVGYGISEGGLNWAPAHIPERELRDVYLHPFEAAVKAGLRSVMNGYHELDGIPCGANEALLEGILRNEWGFGGTVVSDYFSIEQLGSYHRLVSSNEQAAATALEAGVDIELPFTNCYGYPLLSAIDAGSVSVADLDESVRRALRLKFELGLFEDPYVDEGLAIATVNSESQRSLARHIARKSMILLSNDGVLPLGDRPGRVAVIGPNADSARNLYGDYAYPAHVEALLEMRDRDNVFEMPVPDGDDLDEVTCDHPTILDAVRSKYGDAVRYAPGCNINDDDTSGFAGAVALAADSDVVILVVGDKAGLTRECTSGETRDRASLDLPGVQERLVRAVIGTGTPVVTVLVVGRPCGSEYLHGTSAAVLLAWLPGQEGGHAVADVLTGEFNPGGKLPISFPRSAGQIPVFYGHKISGGRSHWRTDYVELAAEPMYRFGHGLSYTTFALDQVGLDPAIAGIDDEVTVSARLTNTGPFDGDEVLQLYVRDPEASITRPVLELKSFVRVAVPVGESRYVQFRLPIRQLGYNDRTMRHVIEPGTIEVFLGTSSASVIRAGAFEVVTADGSIAVEKVFSGSVTVS
jgi:beta-glucosidase